jgi:hypothetical protein
MIRYNWSNLTSDGIGPEDSVLDSILHELPKLSDDRIVQLNSKMGAIAKLFTHRQDEIIANMLEKIEVEYDKLLQSQETQLDDLEEDVYSSDTYELFYKKLESPMGKKKRKLGMYVPSSENLLSHRHIFSVSFTEVIHSIKSVNQQSKEVLQIDDETLKAIGYIAFIIPCISYDKEDEEFLTYKYMSYETMYCSSNSMGESWFCSCETKEYFIKKIATLALETFYFFKSTTKWMQYIVPVFDFFEIYELFIDSRLTNLGGKMSNSPWQQFLKSAKQQCKEIIAGIICTETYLDTKNIKIIKGVVTMKRHEGCLRQLIHVAFGSDSLYGNLNLSKGLFVSYDNELAHKAYEFIGFHDSELYKYSDFEDDKSQDDEMKFMTSFI